jgi:methionyl-tRNA synthetase
VSKFYVTTPIYYVNDAPHVGHSYTTVVADALARWHRLIGDEVFFLTGTDEHGDKIYRAALKNNKTAQEWVDLTSQRFKKAWEALDISYDYFIRTTEERHVETVKKFLSKIYENGFIKLDTYSGYYCVGCEAYKDESEIQNGKCPDHLTPLEWLEEQNYFFTLSQFQDRLLYWYEKYPEAIKPDYRRNEVVAFVKAGLKDVSITRTSTSWGVQVPWDDKHVFYVWYDALVNYLTAIDYPDGKEFSQWWSNVCHLLAKDIIRFHCVWWPAMCMAAGIDPPNQLFIHGHLLVGGKRVSKTRLQSESEISITKISPIDLANEFTSDVIRYYLLREIPLGNDGEFSYENIWRRYNDDLANDLGNLLQRVVTLIVNKLEGFCPGAPEDSPLKDDVMQAIEDVKNCWQHFLVNQALEIPIELIRKTNSYLEETEPWKITDVNQLKNILGSASEVLRIVAVLIYPAMPKTSYEIYSRLGINRLSNSSSELNWGLGGNTRIEKKSPLFPRRASK